LGVYSCARCPRTTRSVRQLVNRWGVDQRDGSLNVNVWYCPACVPIVRAMRALGGAVRYLNGVEGAEREYGVFV
jgi:hypothetical protein